MIKAQKAGDLVAIKIIKSLVDDIANIERYFGYGENVGIRIDEAIYNVIDQKIQTLIKNSIHEHANLLLNSDNSYALLICDDVDDHIQKELFSRLKIEVQQQITDWLEPIALSEECNEGWLDRAIDYRILLEIERLLHIDLALQEDSDTDVEEIQPNVKEEIQDFFPARIRSI